MDVLENSYRNLNPFLNSSVGETEIWGEGNGDFYDVETIHEKAFRQLLDDIEHVSEDYLSRARFLVGAAGTGKSHLFARLRRKLVHGQFTFVSNPPADPWAIKRHILKKVIAGMRRSALSQSGRFPYSQLQRVAYRLLKSIRRFPGLPVHRIHEAWANIRRDDYYPREEDLFIRELERLPMSDIPLHVRRVIFRVLDEETRSLATAWLSGTQSLTDADYARLGVSGPLEDDEVPNVLKWFGSLSIDAGPILLVLDQLDGLNRPEQIGEIESLLIDLKDAARNWYVVVSLLDAKFDFWNRILSDPFKGRFGTTVGNQTMLHVSELSRLDTEQAKELLTVRLSSHSLQAQRHRDGVSNPFYPLHEDQIEELSGAEVFSARALLQKAADAYVEVVSGMAPRARPLGLFLENALADIRMKLTDDDVAVDTNLIADRAKELFNLLSLTHVGSELEPEAGSLHKELRSFRGSDRIYRCNERQVRLIVHDVQQGNSFPSVLKKILDAPPGTVLVRDGRIRAAGPVTRDLLNRFRQDKVFIHLPLEEVWDLHALGALLAKMNEGDFQHERTDPAPTRENILTCLAGHQRLVDTNLAREFIRLAGLGEPEEVPGQPESAGGQAPREPEQPPSSASPDSMVALVREIMEGEGWLAFNRLCARVLSRGMKATQTQVYDCLKAEPLHNKVTVYPVESSPLQAPAVIVWTVEG